MTKEQLQEKTLTAFKQSNKKNIILQWATGVGKSRCAINLLSFIKPKSTLIVVAEIAHINNWKEEFIKVNKSELLDDVIIMCYASLKSLNKFDYEMLILDEVHHSNTEIRSLALDKLNPNNVICLSATIDYNEEALLKSLFGEFFINKVSLKEAILWDILPIPKVYILPLILDSSNKTEEVIEEWGIKEKRRIVECSFPERWKYLTNKKEYPNMRLVMKCTPQEKYDYLSYKSEYYKKRYFLSRVEFQKNLWMNVGSTRKRFLGEQKTEVAKKILSYLKDKRVICFCSSIEQANLLGKEENTIHSKKDNSLEIINQFNQNKIKKLFTVNMLQEGQNLSNIEAGLLIQLDGTTRAFIQKFGRVLRAESPIQIILYYMNTRDDDYLENIKKEIDESFIQVINNFEDLIL